MSSVRNSSHLDPPAAPFLISPHPFCGDSPYWDPNVSWNTPAPDVTLCFVDVTPAWIPALFLLLSLLLRPFHFFRLWKMTRSRAKADEPLWVREAAKLMVASLALGSTIAELAMIVGARKDASASSSSSSSSSSFYSSPAPIIDRSILIASFLLVIILTRLSRFDTTLHSAATLFAFWLLHLLFHLLKLQHFVRGSVASGGVAFVDEELETKFVVTVALTFAASLASVALHGAGRGGRRDSPLDDAGVFSRLTFLWTAPLMRRGFRNPLAKDDLDPLPRRMKIDNFMREFYGKYLKSKNKNINSETFKSNETNQEIPAKAEIPYPFNSGRVPSLAKILPLCHIGSLFLLVILRTLFIISELAKTICLGWLIHHLTFRPSEGFYEEAYHREWKWKGLLYAILLFLVSVIQPYFQNFFWFHTHQLGLKVQSSLTVAIFEKSLRVTYGARRSTTSGEIVNLMSVDARKFYEGIELLIVGFLIPVHVSLAMWILHSQIGSSAFAGMACLLAIVPLNALIGVKTKSLQESHMTFKDARVKMTNEILNSVKVLKFYAWENSFIHRLSELRRKELDVYRRQLLWHSVMRFLTNAAPIFFAIVAFSVIALVSHDKILTAHRAFMTVHILNSIRVSLWWFPASLVLNVHMFVSGRRIDAFLNAEETRDDAVGRDVKEGVAVSVKDASFAWKTGDEPFMQDLSFDLESGQMLAIVGDVGAGKSAMLKAILGEMSKASGTVNRLEKVAYVSQQPWIKNGTVKDNILFGNAMERERYHAVVDACALTPDLEIFPAGDETEIGERGINLSGGQRLRVSLARAIYADMDLYLLDDPLSAVDAHVGKHVFERVLSAEGMLGKKSRIIATNVLTYLPAMDGIVCLENGRISEKGRFDKLKRRSGSFASFYDNFTKQSNSEITNTDATEKIGQKKLVNDKSGGKLSSIESSEQGMVGAKMYVAYLKATGWALAALVIAAFVSAQGFEMGANFILSNWMDDVRNFTSMPHQNTTELDSINIHHLTLYIIAGFCFTLFILSALILLVFGSISASRRLHEDMTRRVLACPSSFFDVTPLGRIVNRFSVDIDTIDVKIPNELYVTYKGLFYIFGSLLVVAVVKPWFLLLVPILVACSFAIQRVYIRSARQLRRLESASRSPIFSLFGETLQGVAVVRAFGMQEWFKEKLRSRVEENLKAAFPMWTIDEVFAFALEKVAAFILLFAAFSTVLEETTTVGEAGLTITYSIAVVTIMISSMRMISNIENSFVAVERVREYSTLPTEAAWRNEMSDNLPNRWPENGRIVFDDYSARYRNDLNFVLKNIDFRIGAGEKIGVVGRTGAGKSSLTLALFRIIEAASGGVAIDGIRTEDLGLHDLRSKISIIPQEPVIFSGSLRTNIDPFGLHTDRELWRILSLAHLSDFVSSLPEGLDHECVEAGENLSVGQRQLVCLARALLRNSKILVLDEATAAVDSKTDSLIQKTIRSEFAESTVLTIAHRINTVVDYDRVMVLRNGRVVELDDPKVLMEDRSSAFYELIRDAGLGESFD